MKKRMLALLATIFLVLLVACIFTACDNSGENNPDNIPDGFRFRQNADGESYALSLYDNSAESVTVPSVFNGKPVTAIDAYAFRFCGGLKSLVIPESVTSIGKGALYKCDALESLTLPFVGDGKDNSFLGYNFGAADYTENGSIVPSTLKSVTVTGGDSVAYGAFHSCSDIVSVVLPDGIESLDKSAFAGCTKLEEVCIPSSVKEIGENAFWNCIGISRIELPQGLEKIGPYAFDGCDKLSSIYIPATVTEIYSTSFEKNGDLSEIIVANSNAVFYSAGNCVIEKASGTVILGCKNSVIPDDGRVKAIGKYAFENCSGLTSVTLPDSVKKIGERAFAYCAGLSELKILSDAIETENYPFYNCNNIVVATLPMNVLIGLEKDNLETLVITSGESITSISMWGAQNLRSVTIPASVVSIDRRAFDECKLLENAVFENPVGWEVSSYLSDTAGTAVSEEELFDAARAAELLVSSYADFYWRKL